MWVSNPPLISSPFFIFFWSLKASCPHESGLKHTFIQTYNKKNCSSCVRPTFSQWHWTPPQFPLLLLNLKRPSHELQNSSQGLGMMGRSHLGMAPAYMVVLKELNMRCSAAMYSWLILGILFSKQPSEFHTKWLQHLGKSLTLCFSYRMDLPYWISHK